MNYLVYITKVCKIEPKNKKKITKDKSAVKALHFRAHSEMKKKFKKIISRM